MHFRVRKNVIQLIRTTYDADKKKGRNAVVGTVKLLSPELPISLREELTDEEVAEYQAWIETHHRSKLLREELAALTVAETMAQAEKWFEREGSSQAARAAATDIMFHWQSIRRIFVKNGLLD